MFCENLLIGVFVIGRGKSKNSLWMGKKKRPEMILCISGIFLRYAFAGLDLRIFCFLSFLGSPWGEVRGKFFVLDFAISKSVFKKILVGCGK